MAREIPSEDCLAAVIKASPERMHTLKDVYQATAYFFNEPDYSLLNLNDFRNHYPPDVLGSVRISVS
jgi:hypothetical protein